MLRELIQSEIKDLLTNSTIGRIGCVHNSVVYIVPVNFRFEKNAALCYSLEGLKIDMMRKNPDVCFEVEQIRDFGNWKTVIGWGRYEEITDEDEVSAIRVQYKLYMLRKRASLTALPADENTTLQHDLKSGNPVYYRIRFTKLTGRCERSL